MSRAAWLNGQHGRSCALVLTLFLFQKGQGFFPPLPIAALLRRSWRGAGFPLAGWEVSMWLGHFAARINGLIFFFRAGVGHTYPPCGLGCFCVARVFCSAKGQRDFKSTLAFVASHEACRRMAV